MNLITDNKQKIALAVGFVAVASLGYFGGQSINNQPQTKQAKSSIAAPLNYSQETASAQTTTQTSTKTATVVPGKLDCAGKIKGSSSLVYHMPDGAFYKRVTNPIRCFDSEKDALAAGFRKSSR